LLLANVPNILCSYWKVADESTALLMIDFYKKLKVSKDDRISDDLRATKLNMIEQVKFSHPYYWAPFVLVGW